MVIIRESFFSLIFLSSLLHIAALDPTKGAPILRANAVPRRVENS